MRKSSILVATLVALIPSVALAAPEAAAAAQGSTGLAGLIAAATAAITAGAALLTSIRSARAAVRADQHAAASEARAVASEARATQAAKWADGLANAQSDGVVLVLSYPGARSCRALLETNGWRVERYAITQAELDAGQLLPGPHLLADVAVADAIVIEGLDPARMATLAAIRPFRDAIRSGAGVALYTGGVNHRYDLALWGECDQGTTTPVTTEAAVRASLARRLATARIQGVRPGQLAAARAQLLG